ncbi:MAG: FtsX-like permease family protein [Actinomycetota bacterium]
MLRLTLKNLGANRVRFLLTTFAVVLAVAFVVSSFVLTDGLRSSFNDLSSDIVGSTDYEIRPADEFGAADVLEESILADAAAVPGVAAAAPLVVTEDTVRPVKGNGEEITINGPPQIAFGWIDEPRLSSLTLVEGEAPDEAGEFTIDIDAAALHDFVVGETYDIITPVERTEATLVGLTRFGAENDTLGATLMQFEVGALQQMWGEGGFDAVSIALGSGADRSAVEAELAALAPGVEVLDQASLESEQQAQFNSAIDIIGNILLGFAGVSLFVSVFIIYNTFSIVLGQRTRELGLLRTLGADPVQLRRSVVLEALVIGVIASIIGIVAGAGLAVGLKELFAAIGAELPESPLTISARTAVVAAVVGVGVTVVAAVGPARKASRVPAIVALRDGAAAGDVGSTLRFALGAALVAVGVAAGSVGLVAASGVAPIVALLALGAITVFVGVTLLSPAIAGPLTSILGWPADAVTGIPGRLARQNAGRNPQRTATTAAALMIGLALVSMALTVGESGKAQLRSTLESSVAADYIVDIDFGVIPTELEDDLRANEVTDELVGFSYDDAEIGDEIVGVMGADLAAMATMFDLGLDEGSADPTGTANAVLVADQVAEAEGIAVGDTVEVGFSSGESRTLNVTGIFTEDIVAEEGYLIDRSVWNEAGADGDVYWLALTLDEGVTIAEADAAFAATAEANQQVTIADSQAFVRGIEAEIDQLLTVINAMVALAVVIALVGIANTLALSVFERTRELGLLRAVGMSRRQLRRMIRFEAAVVALFGATMGVAIGIFFGWAAVLALPDAITSTMAVPATRIAILVAVAGVAGLAAAWGPARRAGRLQVLDAIAS